MAIAASQNIRRKPLRQPLYALARKSRFWRLRVVFGQMMIELVGILETPIRFRSLASLVVIEADDDISVTEAFGMVGLPVLGAAAIRRAAAARRPDSHRR